MKYILIISICFVVSAKVYSSDYDYELSVYRLEEFCFRSLNQVNYNLLTQINLEGSDLGHMTEKKKEVFGDLFKSSYDFCSCIISDYIEDVGFQNVLGNFDVVDFWSSVVPRYSSLSKEEDGCYQERSANDFIPDDFFD